MIKKIKILTMLISLVVAVAMLTSCNGESNNNNVDTGNGNGTVTSPDEAVARVNDRIITEQELLEHMMMSSAVAANRTFSLYSDEELAELRINTLESLITNIIIGEYLRYEVGVEGLDLGFLAVAESIAVRLRENAPISIMLEHGVIDPQNFEEYIEFTQNSNWFFSIVAADVDLSDEAVMAYYEANRENLVRTYVSASHILLPTYGQAEDIMRRLEAGEDFEDLARESSVDGMTRDLGGMIFPEFGRNEVDPDFEAAVFDMEIDEIRGPVRTAVGYHIIRLEGKRTQAPPFGVIRQFIEDVFIRTAANEKLLELRAAATIVYY